MVCEGCGKNEASVFFKGLVNGKAFQWNLCPACAQEKGMEISWPLPSAGFSIAHIMPRLGEAPQEAKCSACGLKYSKFQQTTLLGCSQCYQSFAPQLAPLIKRIHGSLQHQGKRSPVQPSRTAPKDKKNSIKQLRQELEKAVRDENFELAAQLRDQIRELENAA